MKAPLKKAKSGELLKQGHINILAAAAEKTYWNTVSKNN